MNELAKLSVDENLPTLTKAWEHNGEILGITEDGDLIVVARLTERHEARKAPPQPVSRARRKPQESPPGIPASLAAIAEVTEHYTPAEEPDKERETPEKNERERGSRKKKEEISTNPVQES
jgi:hypothetical protein